MSRRWQRVLAVLGICLPVPLSAATGLSIPLPPIVERLAASFVPWAEAATFEGNQALAAGAGGSIVFVPGDVRPGDDRSEWDALRRLAAAHAAEVAEGEADEDEEKSSKDPAKSDPDPGTSDPGPSEPGEPDDDSGLVQETGETVGETADPLLDAGGDVIDDAGGALDDVTGAVGGVVPGLG